jgi:tetratricopeptide (TPR) repeat protein
LFLGAVQRWGGTPTNNWPELLALAALRRGDTASVKDLVRRFPSADSVSRSFLSMNGLRNVARADVFAELGDARSAVAMYEAISPTRFAEGGVPEMGWPAYIRSFLARGRLYEQLGERDRAITAYQEFLRYWADGEAPVQPQLREAREAIARLKEATSVAVPGAVRGTR